MHEFTIVMAALLMKNLMIYFSKTDSFDNPREGWPNDEATLIKIQIENSLDLGWQPADILLFTNFAYQYGPIQATVFDNSTFFPKELQLMKWVPVSPKFVFITKLFQKKLIKKDELYWLHDLDSFQLEPITDTELALDQYDAGAVNYPNPHLPKLTNYHAGSIFFKASAQDLFTRTVKLMIEKNINPNFPFDDEHAFNRLCNTDSSFKKRIKHLNWRYTIKRWDFERFKDAIKPIKIAHFRPDKIRWSKESGNLRSFDKFTGENEFHVSIIPERMIRIFSRHGIEKSKQVAS
jgi:hypothetical protein